MKMNILILSSGTRDKIVQYFKRELEGRGRIIATDNSKLASSIYKADKFYIVPKITEPSYLQVIEEICRKEKIAAVFSLIDPELSLLAENKELFENIGTKVITADYENVEICFDKLHFAQFLKSHNFETQKTYGNIQSFKKAYEEGKIDFPVFVKPRKGSASIHISEAGDMEELAFLKNKYKDLIIQEYMTGQEIGVDVYVDLISHKVTSMFIKEKIRMRAGETDKSVSIKDEALFLLVQKLAKELNLRGQNDIDIFRQDGKYYISEVNPRFGGGYPHAYECGVNFPMSLIRNLEGEENKETIGEYKEGIYMVKYNEVTIIR